MQPYQLQTSFSFLAVISFVSICIPKSFCQDAKFVTCGETFLCGDFNISYPFWGGTRPESCGYPGLELACESNVSLLKFRSLRYRILAIDGSQQLLTVARDDLWNSLCPRFIYNTTFDHSIFRYSASELLQNLTFSYGCRISVSDYPRQPNQFDCSVNGTNNSVSFYSTNTLGINQTAVTCSSSITVPVNNQTRNQVNLGNSSALKASLKEGFVIKWTANDSVCEECTRSGGRCGFNSNNHSFVCYCNDRPYDLKCGGFRRVNDPPDLPLFASGISFGTVAWMAAIAGLSYLSKRCLGRKGMIRWVLDDEDNADVEVFLRNYGSLAPKYYSFTEIKLMTDSFAHKLGQGGYGFVYKGRLSDGHQVAVKVLRDNNKGNGEDFINEVASISRTSHVNVVTLLGFCYEANRRALVYDFMPNGSLDKFICRKESKGADCRLEWEVLYRIAVGTARGLDYLHQGCNTRIVHFDIKPHNILLDEDFCPKISDFGLAKLCKKKESILSRMDARGTVGYIAPEVIFRGVGGVSHKSDVYSYGMMVLEMVGLKSRVQVDIGTTSSEIYFPNWIYERLELDMDLELEGVKNIEDEEAAMKMILVGLWCIQTRPSDRPSMSKVVEMLESSIQSLQIPPKPYFLESPAAAAVRSIQESSEISFS